MFVLNAKEKKTGERDRKCVCVATAYLLTLLALVSPTNLQALHRTSILSTNANTTLSSAWLINKCCSMSKGTPPSLWPYFQKAEREIPRKREESNSLSALGKRCAVGAMALVRTGPVSGFGEGHGKSTRSREMWVERKEA